MKFNVSSYNPDIFNGLPSLVEAKAALDENQGMLAIPKMGPIFRKYNQQHKFGLVLLHRHFNQDENEVTVEILSDARTISMPWTWTFEDSECEMKPSPMESSCLEDEGMSQDELTKVGKVVRPHSWKFDQKGKLSPYEFFVTNMQEEEEDPQEEFVSKLYSALKSFGLHEILGLHLLHRGETGFKMAVETSHPSRRVNVMNLKKEDELLDPSFINVVWGFWRANVTYVCRCFGVNTGHAHIGTQS